MLSIYKLCLIIDGYVTIDLAAVWFMYNSLTYIYDPDLWLGVCSIRISVFCRVSSVIVRRGCQGACDATQEHNYCSPYWRGASTVVRIMDTQFPTACHLPLHWSVHPLALLKLRTWGPFYTCTITSFKIPVRLVIIYIRCLRVWKFGESLTMTD